jgi:two-component system, LuxR family, response regulator FixJ
MTDAIVSIIDDDPDVRDSLRSLLESAGIKVRAFDSAKKVLDDPTLSQSGCLIADIRMPDMDGLTLQEELVRRQIGLPVIVVTGHGDVPLAVRAMRAGAVDFLEKPFDDELLLDSVRRALSLSAETRSKALTARVAKDRIDLLTERERQVLAQLIAGHANKVIAYKLDISPRTVEIHRANLMGKMQARSVSELVRLAIAAGLSSSG